MNSLTVFEYDHFFDCSQTPMQPSIPTKAFSWLENMALQENEDAPESRCIQVFKRSGQRAVRVCNYVGVLRTPDGFQLEILPKAGKKISTDGQSYARGILLKMLSCLKEFEHIKTVSALLKTAKMPLWEIFIAEFLQVVTTLLKRGLSNTYITHEDNIFALRGKLLFSEHIKRNICRKDRFYTAFDLFSSNRPENRLLHAAVRHCLKWTRSASNMQLAHELCFAFADVPIPANLRQDFQQVQLDRNMGHYELALAWARLLLFDQSPLTGAGVQSAPSLLFPMEKVFEAYVEKHIRTGLKKSYSLTSQARSKYLVEHNKKKLFQLKPDFLIHSNSEENHVILDAKWKLLEQCKDDSRSKYELSQHDFYQLYAYAHKYFHDCHQGQLVLIYPQTDTFRAPLPVFAFLPDMKFKLWVVPFDFDQEFMSLPDDSELHNFFEQ